MLRELGNKVEKMEKLSPGDILLQVHAAAEDLQMKIDQKSYILVNQESWEGTRRQKELDDPENYYDSKEYENRNRVITSLSQTWSATNSFAQLVPTEDTIIKPSWPRLSVAGNLMINELESKVYESASSLSLATFSSLLIEFVARLQNLVDAYKELSEIANFKEPMELQVPTKDNGFCARLSRCFRLKN